ncbi:MAG: glutaminase A [Firmicutes bacterium]|nr:glutaminase A [Bacillota bacterium]
MNQAQLQQVLEGLVADHRSAHHLGQVADYIPELGKGDPSLAGIAVWSPEGLVSAGDCRIPFTLQSISKIFTLMVVLRDRGEEEVFSRVGSEPTGDPFNSIVKLETAERRPLNPMINAGAIAVCGMLEGKTLEERFARVTDLLEEVLGRPVSIDENVYRSEKETGHRNRALAYFLKDTGVLDGDVEEVVDIYFRQCSILVTCEELARLGLFVANKGVTLDGRRLLPRRIVRLVSTFMVTCGMYNASGEFAINVGIPAKSGVAGGILAVVPERFGIGTFGPALDRKGNSIVGVRMLRDLSRQFELSIF